jgi:hypothetical protein
VFEYLFHLFFYFSTVMDQANFIRIALAENRHRFHYHLRLEDFLYKSKSSTGDVTYLRCIEHHCQCRAKLVGNMMIHINPNIQHNHPSHVFQIEFESAYETLREQVRLNRRQSISQLHSDALKLLTREGAALMAWDSVRRTLQRIRYEEMPPCASLEQLTTLLEDNNNVVARKFGMVRQTQFYQGTVDGCLIFANLELIAALPAEFGIYTDGTFNVVPFGADQLFVVMGELRGRPRPLMYAIMPRRRREDYVAVLGFFANAILSFDGAERVPNTAMSDFEHALRLAILEIWPHIQKRGCNFHFCQAIRRYARSIQHLAALLVDSQIHKECLRMFLRLSLLPRPRVQAGYDAIIIHINENNLAEDFEEFIQYFEATWFGMFNVDEWCVSEDARRTNNNTEGYNNKIKLKIPLRPSPWIFLDSLIDLAYDASSKYYSEVLRDSQPPPDRSTLTALLNAALDELNEGYFNELGFLKKMAGAQPDALELDEL